MNHIKELNIQPKTAVHAASNNIVNFKNHRKVLVDVEKSDNIDS